jgi:hypothetical protein
MNLVMAVRLRGRLNLTALRQAFDDIVACHEVLRSVIAVAGGQLVQRPLPGGRVPCHLVALASLQEQAVGGCTERLLAAAAQPFDPAGASSSSRPPASSVYGLSLAVKSVISRSSLRAATKNRTTLSGESKVDSSFSASASECCTSSARRWPRGTRSP